MGKSWRSVSFLRFERENHLKIFFLCLVRLLAGVKRCALERGWWLAAVSSNPRQGIGIVIGFLFNVSWRTNTMDSRFWRIITIMVLQYDKPILWTLNTPKPSFFWSNQITIWSTMDSQSSIDRWRRHSDDIFNGSGTCLARPDITINR